MKNIWSQLNEVYYTLLQPWGAAEMVDVALQDISCRIAILTKKYCSHVWYRAHDQLLLAC